MPDLLSRGFIDRVERRPDRLRLFGWLAAYEPTAITGLRVDVGGQSHEVLDLFIEESPDIAEVHPFLSGAEACRFTLDVASDAQETAGGALVSLRATFHFGRSSLPVFHIAEPSVALPSEDVVEAVGGGTQSGLEFLSYLVGLAGLTPGQSVLDIGCGVGRMAFPLAHFLEKNEGGRYTGFDVVRESIEWARENLGTAFPQLDFRHVDVHNGMYNPDGELDPLGFAFPVETDSVDVAFLSSVFTHMLHGEVNHYLDEMTRVVRPGGRLLISCFLLDAEVRSLMRDGRSQRVFEMTQGQAFIERADVPEAAVAYEDAFFADGLSARGLRIDGRFHGSWSGRAPSLSYQDILVVAC